MKIIKTYIILFLLVTSMLSHAQKDLTYFHLGSTTPQSHIYNPVFFPDARFYISLPVMSGIHASAKGGLTLNEVFTRVDGTNDVLIDPNKVLGHINEGDRFSLDLLISMFQMGVRIGDNNRFNLFVNDRISASFYYPKSLVSYVLVGNAHESNLGKINTDKNLKAEGVYFREYGIGYARDILLTDNKKLSVGLKVKYLQGMANLHVQDDARYSLQTSKENLQINASTNHMRFNMAGNGIDVNDLPNYLINNGNRGLGIDLGAQLNWTEKLNFSLAVNDLGRIYWTEHVKGYTVEDSQIEFGGLNLKDLGNASQILKDTISALVKYSEDSLSYRTNLNTRVFLSANYKVLKNGTVSGTVLARKELGRPVFTYGIGYNHQFGKILKMTTTVATGTNSSVNWGGGFAARLGIMQLYGTVENTFGKIDVRDTERIGVRFGINLLFGRNDRKSLKETPVKQPKPEKSKEIKTKLSPFPPEYNLDHLENL